MNLTSEDINDNIKFIGSVVQTTLNNISLDELTDIAKEDLLMIDNFAVAYKIKPSKREVIEDNFERVYKGKGKIN